jgi:hypothetical protein
MKRTPAALAVAALAVAGAAVPAAAAQNGVSGAGITYTIPVSAASGVAGQCTVVADRWTADYGPTHVYAVAESPFAAWTRIRCTVTKGGTTWVDQEAYEYGPLAVINEGDGTMPVAGVTVCAEIESQLTVDARPSARNCQTF